MSVVSPAGGRALCLLLCVASGSAVAFSASLGPPSSSHSLPGGFTASTRSTPESQRSQHNFSHPVRGGSSNSGFGMGVSQPRNSRSAGGQQYRPYSMPVYISINDDLPGMVPPATRHGSTQARIETELSEVSPVVDEAVIYTVRVVTDRNVKTLDPVLPRSDSISIEKVEGPVTRSRMRVGGYPEIINEYRFALTPVKVGKIVVSPIRMKGTMAVSQPWYNAPPFNEGESSSKSFTVSSDEPVRLEVRPADPAVQPWLPLSALTIHGQLTSKEATEAGQPVELTVELKAVGAAGDHLPSLERQLKGHDFRVYLESSTTDRELSGDKRVLHGTRVETYTLVPLHGGNLQLPRLRVAWWNTGTRTAEVSTLALDALAIANAAGDSGAHAAPAKIPRSEPLAAFWIPLLLFTTVLLAYWGWIGLRERLQADGMKLANTRLGTAFGRVRTPFVRARYALVPSNMLQNLRFRVVMLMPASMKLWFCSRCIQEENEPSEWCQMFKFLACKHLDMQPQTPLPEIGDRIVDVHRGTQPDRVRAMLQELDGAMYGGQKLDFEKWKSTFRRELRPRFFWRRKQPAMVSGKLPALNP